MEDLKHLTDERIAEHVRTKDQEAYLEIMRRYQGKLMRYANVLTQDEMKSADIVQNSFLKAFVNLNSFDAKMKFSTWIYRIVHNEAMNEIAKYRRETPMLDGIDFGSGENIEADFTKKESQEMVRGCLSRMPVMYSEPLSLFYFEEKSYEEISDILRVPIGTVGTRISRAKALMKKLCTT